MNNSSDALAGLVFGEENHVPNNVEYGLVGGYRNYVESRSLVDCNLVYGERDTVAGRGSMALGRSININAQRSVGIGGFIDIDHQGSFVFTDGRNGTLSSGGNHTMTMRFTGGYSLFTNNGLSTGVQLTPGSSAWSSISDRRAKNSIDPVYYGLNAVMKLKPSQYYYNGNDFKSLGFIAQEVKEVVPEVVVVPEDSTQMMSVRYTELIPVLTKAIQEQQAQIEALKAENAALKADASATASNLETKVNALMLLMEQNGISTTASK